MTEQLRFNEDQPRDPDGKWTSGEETKDDLSGKDSTPAKAAIAALDAAHPANPLNPRESVLIVDGEPVGRFEVVERAGRVRIKSIESFTPGSGAGTKILNHITDAADKAGATLELTASSFGSHSMSSEQLHDWYGRHGFIDEPGYDTAYGHMIREPKSERSQRDLSQSSASASGTDRDDMTTFFVDARETEKPIHKLGSTQANIADGSDAADALNAARMQIADSDLHGKGRDVGGNHITVRYGIAGDEHEGLRAFLCRQSPFEATLGKTATFSASDHSEGAAVIIAPVDSPELHRLNEELAEHAVFTPPSFEYHPHATVAYVHQDKADKYVGMSATDGKKVTVDTISITTRGGEVIPVALIGKPVPNDNKWKSQGIGYGNVGAQGFPEACDIGPQGEPLDFRTFDPEQPRDADGKFASGDVAKFKNEEDGIEAHVTTMNNGKFSATLHDVESGNVLPQAYVHADKDKVIAKAKAWVGLRHESRDDEGGQWVTIHGEHIYIKDGVVTKGPANLLGSKTVPCIVKPARDKKSDYSGPLKQADGSYMKNADGSIMRLSADRIEKYNQLRENAEREIAKVPAEVREQLAAGKDTAAIFSTGKDGERVYSDEWLASYHTPEINRMADGLTPSIAPLFAVSAGGPASGKSGATEKLQEELGVKTPINVDIIRTHDPLYGAFMPDNLRPLNEEAGDVRNEAVANFIGNRYNVLIDGVGSQGTVKQMAEANANGYRTSYIYTHCDIPTAEFLAEQRPYHAEKIEDLRILPENMVAGAHNKGRDTFPVATRTAWETKVLDKTDPSFGRDGKVIYWRRDGVTLKFDREGIERMRKGDDERTHEIQASAFIEG
jgi:2'-5' RNA ligase